MSDAYIVVYTWSTVEGGKENHIIYFWQGKDSSRKTKGTSAYKTVEVGDEYQQTARQIRVLQGKEPRHFLLIFKNRFIIHKGSFIKRELEKTKIYQIFGDDPIQVRAIQMNSSNYLNCNHAYLIQPNETKQYIWLGKHCNEHEKKAVFNFAKQLQGQREQEVIEEGNETEDFWKQLEHRNYERNEKQKLILNSEPGQHTHKPRLFEANDKSGVVVISEIYGFTSEDLDSQLCYMLDSVAYLFVWIGKQCKTSCKTFTLETAQDYSKEMEKVYKHAPTLYVVNEGNEPLEFISCFTPWNKNLNKIPDLNELQQVKQELEKLGKKIYTYKQLTSRPLPEGVDQTKLESYLSDEEFNQIFKMTKEEFYKMQKWKQNRKKQELDLF